MTTHGSSNMNRIKTDPPGAKDSVTKEPHKPKETKRYLADEVGEDILDRYGSFHQSLLGSTPLYNDESFVHLMTPSQQAIFSEFKTSFLKRDKAPSKQRPRTFSNDNATIQTRVVESNQSPSLPGGLVAMRGSSTGKGTVLRARELSKQFRQTQAVAYVPAVRALFPNGRRGCVIYVCPARFTKDKCPDSLRLISYMIDCVHQRQIGKDPKRQHGKVALLLDMKHYRFGSSLQDTAQQSFTLENWIALLEMMQQEGADEPKPVFKVGQILVLHATADVQVVYQTILQARNLSGRIRFLDSTTALSTCLTGDKGAWPTTIGGNAVLSNLINGFLKHRIAMECLSGRQRHDNASSLHARSLPSLRGFTNSHKDDFSITTADLDLEDAQRARLMAGNHASLSNAGTDRSKSAPKPRGMVITVQSNTENEADDLTMREKEQKKKKKSSKKKHRSTESGKEGSSHTHRSSKTSKSKSERKKSSSSRKKPRDEKSVQLAGEFDLLKQKTSRPLSSTTSSLFSDSESSTSQRITRRFRLDQQDLTKGDLMTPKTDDSFVPEDTVPISVAMSKPLGSTEPNPSGSCNEDVKALILYIPPLPDSVLPSSTWASDFRKHSIETSQDERVDQYSVLAQKRTPVDADGDKFMGRAGSFVTNEAHHFDGKTVYRASKSESETIKPRSRDAPSSSRSDMQVRQTNNSSLRRRPSGKHAHSRELDDPGLTPRAHASPSQLDQQNGRLLASTGRSSVRHLMQKTSSERMFSSSLDQIQDNGNPMWRLPRDLPLVRSRSVPSNITSNGTGHKESSYAVERTKRSRHSGSSRKKSMTGPRTTRRFGKDATQRNLTTSRNSENGASTNQVRLSDNKIRSRQKSTPRDTAIVPLRVTRQYSNGVQSVDVSGTNEVPPDRQTDNDRSGPMQKVRRSSINRPVEGSIPDKSNNCESSKDMTASTDSSTGSSDTDFEHSIREGHSPTNACKSHDTSTLTVSTPSESWPRKGSIGSPRVLSWLFRGRSKDHLRKQPKQQSEQFPQPQNELTASSEASSLQKPSSRREKDLEPQQTLIQEDSQLQDTMLRRLPLEHNDTNYCDPTEKNLLYTVPSSSDLSVISEETSSYCSEISGTWDRVNARKRQHRSDPRVTM